MTKRILCRSINNDTSALSDFHPILRRVLAAREITQPEEIDRTLHALIS